MWKYCHEDAAGSQGRKPKTVEDVRKEATQLEYNILKKKPQIEEKIYTLIPLPNKGPFLGEVEDTVDRPFFGVVSR